MQELVSTLPPARFINI